MFPPSQLRVPSDKTRCKYGVATIISCTIYFVLLKLFFMVVEKNILPYKIIDVILQNENID